MAYTENFCGQVMPTSRLPEHLRGGIIGDSKFILAPGESFDECPYNKSHLVRNVRMKYHLLKCRLNYIYFTEKKGEEVVYAPCPYGHCSAIPYPELAYHIERCKPFGDNSFDPPYYNSKEFKERMRKEKEDHDRNWALFKANGTFDEDWEKEAKKEYVPGYDPRYKLVREKILMYPPLLTRMERREFREKFIVPAHEERLRKAAMAAEKKEDPNRDPFEVLYAGVNRDT